MQLNGVNPIQILNSLGDPVMEWQENEVLYNVNLSSNNANLTTANIGVDNDQLNLDGNTAGKSLIESSNSMHINMDGNGPMAYLELQSQGNAKIRINTTETLSSQPIDMQNNTINNVPDPTTNL